MTYIYFFIQTYLAAVLPVCEEDIVNIVNYARENGIPFAARSGHHCVTTSMRRLQDGILIDMRALKHMEFDKEASIVTIGGGTLTDDFARYLHSIGKEVSKFFFPLSLL